MEEIKEQGFWALSFSENLNISNKEDGI